VKIVQDLNFSHLYSLIIKKVVFLTKTKTVKNIALLNHVIKKRFYTSSKAYVKVVELIEMGICTI
jgi:hypothetical protein